MQAQLKKVTYHKTPHNSGFEIGRSRKLTLGRLVAVNTQMVQSIPCWGKTLNGKPISEEQISKMSNPERMTLVFLGYKYIYHRNYTV